MAFISYLEEGGGAGGRGQKVESEAREGERVAGRWVDNRREAVGGVTTPVTRLSGGREGGGV